MRDSGAHFYRCDFQVHTPRDAQWKGVKHTTDAEREAYAKGFVAECRRIGLHAVAITDHHDLVFARIIRRAAAEETDDEGTPLPEDQRLVVFPGVEVTFGAPSSQALVLFDADLPDDRLSVVLEAFAIDAHDPGATSLPAVTPLDHIKSLKALHEALDTREWLRRRYIVLPNVTDGGHKTIMRSGMQAHYKEMPCVGGYLDGSVEAIGTGNARIFAGKDSNYGNKRLAFFQTSDSRSATFADLAKHSTWVKWAKPTAEALRQACLAQESRISQDEPDLPNVAISEIRVSNSKFLGPVALDLNPQYNAIIGGRGTGKSTILGYLRWALCDEPVEAASDAEVANPGLRQHRLIETTLKPVNAQVEVHFQINEVPHIVRRDSMTGDLLLKVGSAEFKSARESEVRGLLPIHAYSQKQLSSVSVRIEELTRFVTAPIQTQLDSVDREIAELAGRLRENYATLQRQRVLTKEIDRSVLALQSIGDQAENLRRSLSGLSQADRQVLGSKPAHDAARQAVEASDADLARARRLLEGAYTQLDDLGPHGNKPSEPSGDSLARSVAELRRQAAQVIIQGAEALRSVIADIVAAEGESPYGEGRRGLLEELERFEESYSAVKQRSTAHEHRLKELARLDEQQAAARRLLAQERAELQALGNPAARHDELRQQLIDLTVGRSEAIAEQCRSLTTQSEGLLRAELKRGIGLDDAQTKFRSLIAGSNVRGKNVEALFESLRAETNPLTTWESVLAELEQLLLAEPDAPATSEQAPVLSRLGLAPVDQGRAKPKLTPDGWLDLALTPIKDFPVFEYQTKEAEYIAFEMASAGQQATALLRVLLAQTGMPLVIDQPEDDLDSQVVVDVVERIWAAKPQRQLIFTSHNANLVVNGDAELVVVCDNRSAGDQSGGEIKQRGAIDVPDVREAITRIMEGGEPAFKLRKEKYGF